MGLPDGPKTERVVHLLNCEVVLDFSGCPVLRGVGEGWGFGSSLL